MKNQPRLFEGDNADPEIAKAADHYVELVEEKKEKTEAIKKAESRLISLMKKVNKPRVQHKGQIIEVKIKEACEVVKFKKVKGPKS